MLSSGTMMFVPFDSNIAKTFPLRTGLSFRSRVVNTVNLSADTIKLKHCDGMSSLGCVLAGITRGCTKSCLLRAP